MINAGQILCTSGVSPPSPTLRLFQCGPEEGCRHYFPANFVAQLTRVPKT